jgi:hypothetical protein
MRADSPKQPVRPKGPQRFSGPAPEEQGENGPKTPPSIVDLKVGTEGKTYGLTDRLVDGKETDPSAAARKKAAARRGRSK